LAQCCAWLIGHVVPDGTALDKALEVAAVIGSNGPRAVEAIKRSVRETEKRPPTSTGDEPRNRLAAAMRSGRHDRDREDPQPAADPAAGAPRAGCPQHRRGGRKIFAWGGIQYQGATPPFCVSKVLL